MSGKVIHVTEIKNHPDAVYIGRAMPRVGLKRSSWANPFVIGVDGDRADVIRKYRDLFIETSLQPGRRSRTLRELRKLRGRPLACWCRKSTDAITDDNRCHGDVLLEIIEREFGS